MGGGDFDTFAAQALGTDDPEKISALKEAIMACMGAEEEGEYEEEPMSDKGGGLSMLFGGKKE